MYCKLTRWIAGFFVAVGLSACGGGGGGGGGGALPVGLIGAPGAPTATAPVPNGVSSTPTDASNGTPGGTNTGGVQPPVVSKPEILFTAIPGAGAILSFQTQNPAPGSKLQAKAITGFQSYLGEALAYDQVNDRLFASTGADILVFDKASTLDGTVAPTRTINATGTGIMVFSNIFLDKSADTIYLTGSAQNNDVLAVIGNASTATGSVKPNHIYGMASGSRGFTIDTQRKLLYGLGSTVAIFVFDLTLLEDLKGLYPINQAVRVITIPELSVMSGVAIDQARDRLYVAGFGKLGVIDNASTAKGRAPLVSFSVPAHSTTFDAAYDRLYVGATNAAYIINNASSLKAGSTIPATVAVGNSQGNYLVGGFAFP